jgi:hypothetical protein
LRGANPSASAGADYATLPYLGHRRKWTEQDLPEKYKIHTISTDQHDKNIFTAQVDLNHVYMYTGNTIHDNNK